MELESLVGQELSAVEFVQDYVQLRFDGPLVTFYEWPEVFREEGSYAFGEPEYRNVLCALIGESVSAASVEEGEARGRLAVTLDMLTDALILVGQHGVYCTSARNPSAPALDLQVVMKEINGAKELVGAVMERL